jgi:SSS family solute:Na+ symporter
MFGLGFFSKQTTEKGLLVGVAVGFVIIWYVATKTTIAWPWYCLIGGVANVVIALIASRLIDGRQTEWSEYSIKGQQRKFKEQGLPEKDGGWYLVPGKIDKASYYLLGFFFLTILFLFGFEKMI